MFSILLARHPPVRDTSDRCYGRKDMALDDGWEDHVAGWSGEGPIFCSPTSRCRIAAARLGSGKATALHDDPRLLEMNFGTWEGQLWSAIPRCELDEWAADPLCYRPGGGESVADLKERVTAFWHERMRAAISCRIVTHGGPLRVIMALAENRLFRVEDCAPSQGRGVLLHFSNNHDGFAA